MARVEQLLATTEQMLIHVDMNKAKASEIDQSVFRILQKIWNKHEKLPSPKQKGRVMQIKLRLIQFRGR